LAPRRRDRVLEIGTGSGYQTAILARLAGRVYTIERLPDLLVEAEERFRRLGLTNIETRLGDGAAGWPECAPFQGIIVTAAAPSAGECHRGDRDSGLHEDAQPVARASGTGRRHRGVSRVVRRERDPGSGLA